MTKEKLKELQKVSERILVLEARIKGLTIAKEAIRKPDGQVKVIRAELCDANGRPIPDFQVGAIPFDHGGVPSIELPPEMVAQHLGEEITRYKWKLEKEKARFAAM